MNLIAAWGGSVMGIRPHFLALIRNLLQKAGSAGWGGGDTDAVCDSKQGALALAGA